MTDAPFVPPSIRVVPEHLWYQSDVNLVPAGETLHARAARAIREGVRPEETDYAIACRDHPYRTDGRCGGEVIAGLLRALETGAGLPHIKTAIDARGRIVIADGIHRAAAALALGRELDAEVVYRDQTWIAFRYAVWRFHGNTTRLYQPVDHPDIPWPCWRRDTQRRAELVHAHVPEGATGIDLACNAGGLTCALARHGHPMTGLDIDAHGVRAATLRARMARIGTEGGATARFEVCDDIPTLAPADFAVCFSLLNHHVVDGRDAIGQEIFRRLVACAPVVFLDAPAPRDEVGGDTHFSDPEVFLRWCRDTGAPGGGVVLARHRADPLLQRDLLQWRR